MTVLVIGGNGLLGRELVRQALAAGHGVAATYLTRPPGPPEVAWHALDVRDGEQVTALMSAVRPDLVVNAAGRKDDWASIDHGAANLATAAVAVAARLVHVSSDAVFSGAVVHCDETARPDPVTTYGTAKTLAETRTKIIAPAAVIIRTSLIIGEGDSPHERRVHDLAAGRAGGVLFTDDVRCPVHVTDLAAAIFELASSGRAGVHHVAGADAVSRHELGRLIARRDGLDPAALPSGRRAETDLPGALDVRLDCTRTRRLLGTRLRGAREFLRPR